MLWIPTHLTIKWVLISLFDTYQNFDIKFDIPTNATHASIGYKPDRSARFIVKGAGGYGQSDRVVSQVHTL